MGKSRPNRAGLFGVAVILASGGFLAACAVDPIDPTAAAAAGSVDPAPVSTTKHVMATDIAGPVDLGPEPATVQPTEIASAIRDAQGVMHTAPARQHSLAGNQHHRLVIASTPHRKSPRQITARRAPARKQAKVSAETRVVGPKT